MDISKKLAELMEGTVGVESELGQGSTFWFTAEFEKQNVQIATPKDAQTLSSLTSLRVLIVDDNTTSRDMLKYHCDQWHTKSYCVENGRDAVDFLTVQAEAGEPIHLVLLDMKMPTLDGVTVATIIKSTPLIAQTTLIMLMVLHQTLTPEVMRLCLLKPIHVRRLRRSLCAVAKALQLRSLQNSPTTHSLRHSTSGSFSHVSSDSDIESLEHELDVSTATKSRALTPQYLSSHGASIISSLKKSQSCGSLSRKEGRILVADDNVINRRVLRQQLKKLGMYVRV